jgi:hypothetical protein
VRGIQVLQELKRSVGKKVRLGFSDGEVITADLTLILEDEDAIIFDLLGTNQPDKYGKPDKPPHIFASIADIVTCQPLEDT